MTVIIGIQCEDGGIVVAADSAATFITSTGAPTAKQPISKLSIISNQVIFGHSGTVGMGQRLEAIVKDSWDKKNLAKKYDPIKAMQFLRNRFWQEVVKDEVDVVNQSGPQLSELAKQFVMQQFLVALPPIKDSNRPCLIHFNWQCAPEMLNNQLPCVALGNGQPIADPFLSFIRRVIWSNGAPTTIADGKFAATWTLRYVLETSPAYISGPEQLVVLKQAQDDQGWVAEEFSDTALDLHIEHVTSFEEYLSEYPNKFRP